MRKITIYVRKIRTSAVVKDKNPKNFSPAEVNSLEKDDIRLANVGILGKKRELGVGKLGWYGNLGKGLLDFFF